MMDGFAQILWRMPTMTSASSMSIWFGDATPIKVQVNFDIPLFEGKIDADILYNWLNVLEGYSLSTTFLKGKRSPLRSLRQSPMSKTGRVLIVSKTLQMSLKCLKPIPLGHLS